MATNEEDRRVFVGVAAGAQRISVVGSEESHRAFSIRGQLDPERWAELVSDHLGLEPPLPIYACVAVASGTTGRETEAIVRAGREAGWDAILIVSSLLAALPESLGDALRPVVHVDQEVSSVGFVRGERLEAHDRVRSIPGREARELAVSLRCLHKELVERRERLRGEVLVVGEADEVARIGRRALTRELESLGVRVRFDLDPHRVARGAIHLAEHTTRARWRRLRRAQR